MAKEVAIGKKAKISEAQQYMLLAVLGASLFLGAGISLSLRFINQISFNSEVIAEQEKSITSFSNVIKETGICKSPKGSIYSQEELNSCDPDGIEVSEIPGTLRSNILEGLAASEALNSVPKEDSTECRNQNGEIYTYKELTEIYNNAQGSAELTAASQLIKRCSALRVIPDALPAYRNEEALLASLNKIFNISNWEPESISPSEDSYTGNEEEETGEVIDVGAETIAVQLSIEADTGTTMTVLNNLERSIRDFNILEATVEWEDENSLSLQAQATAYYTNAATLTKKKKTVSPGSKSASNSNSNTTEANQ